MPLEDSIPSSSPLASPAQSPSSSPRNSQSINSDSNSLSLISIPSSTQSSQSHSHGPVSVVPQRNENIIVAVRVRPFDKRELVRDEFSAWEIDTEDNEMRQTMTNTKYKHQRINNSHSKVDQPPQLLSFKCGNLFDQETKTEDMYGNIVHSIVESAMKGINGTCFAYGQTSSGKTFTMKGNNESPGVIRLAMQQVFETIRANEDHEWLLRVSYLEIYNENVRDLLNPVTEDLPVHESKERGVYVQQKEIIVNSVENVLKIMDQGESQRHYGKTMMNDLSSRSHTIFRLVIESKKKKSEEELAAAAAALAAVKKGGRYQTSANALKKEKVKCSVLNFVDLAGSERLSQTQAQGQQQKEGMCINKSLLFLGLVISRLAAGDKLTHIPFRDSKLTRILQSSLGGNSRTAIICNVSPALSNCEHTINTLRFGANAIKIRNHAKVNEITGDKALIHRHEREIAELQSRLSTFPEGENDQTCESVDNSELLDHQEEKFDHESERRLLEEEREKTREQKAVLESKVEELRRLILTSSSLDTNSGLPINRRRATFGGTQEFTNSIVNNGNAAAMANGEENENSSLFFRVEQQRTKIGKLEGLLSELSIENTQLMSQVSELTNEQEALANQLEELAVDHEKLAIDNRARQEKLAVIELGSGMEERPTAELAALLSTLEVAQKRILKHLHWREFAASTQIQLELESESSATAPVNINRTINFIEKTQRLESEIVSLRSQLRVEQEKQMSKDTLLMNNIQQFELYQSQSGSEQTNLQLKLDENNKELNSMKSEYKQLLNENSIIKNKLLMNEKEFNELKNQNVEYSIQLLKHYEGENGIPSAAMKNNKNSTNNQFLIHSQQSSSSSLSDNQLMNNKSISSSMEIKPTEWRTEEILQNLLIDNTADATDNEETADENSTPLDSQASSTRSSIGRSQELSLDDLLAHHSQGDSTLPPHLQWAAGLTSASNGNSAQLKNPVLSLIQPNNNSILRSTGLQLQSTAAPASSASKSQFTPMKPAATPINTPIKPATAINYTAGSTSAAKTGIPMRTANSKITSTGTASKRK